MDMTEVVLLAFGTGFLDDLHAAAASGACTFLGQHIYNTTLLGLTRSTSSHVVARFLIYLLLRWKARTLVYGHTLHPVGPRLAEFVLLPPYAWTLVQLPVQDVDIVLRHRPEIREALIQGIREMGNIRRKILGSSFGNHFALRADILRKTWKRPTCRVRQRVALLHFILIKEAHWKLPRLRQLFCERVPYVRQAVFAIIDAAACDHRVLTYGAVNVVATYLGVDLSTEYYGLMPLLPLDPFLIWLTNGYSTCYRTLEDACEEYWQLIESATLLC